MEQILFTNLKTRHILYRMRNVCHSRPKEPHTSGGGCGALGMKSPTEQMTCGKSCRCMELGT